MRPSLARLHGVVASLLVVVLTACGALEVAPSAADSSLGAGEVMPPAADAFLPPNIPASTPWTRMASQPSGFDLEGSHASVSDLADAFGAAIFARPDGRPDRPELGLDVIDETDERALLIVSETGIGDDSVAGTQYALVVGRESGGWRVDELWTRTLCWRGVSGDLCV